MDTITVSGIVLSAMTVGETDHRLVLLSKEQGRISVFARGACRPKSTLTAVSRPFVTGEFTLIPRRDSYSLQSAAVRDYFDSLTGDFDQMAYGFYFLELAGCFSAEEAGDANLLNLLYVTLKALERQKMPRPLIRLVCEYRMFVTAGEYPQVFTCSRCQKPLTEGWFSMQSRSAVCRECGREGDGEYLSPSAVYALQYILTAPLGKLYSFRLDRETYDPLARILRHWKKRYLDRELKSETLLKTVEGAELTDFLQV